MDPSWWGSNQSCPPSLTFAPTLDAELRDEGDIRNGEQRSLKHLRQPSFDGDIVGVPPANGDTGLVEECADAKCENTEHGHAPESRPCVSALSTTDQCAKIDDRVFAQGSYGVVCSLTNDRLLKLFGCQRLSNDPDGRRAMENSKKHNAGCIVSYARSQISGLQPFVVRSFVAECATSVSQRAEEFAYGIPGPYPTTPPSLLGMGRVIAKDLHAATLRSVLDGQVPFRWTAVSLTGLILSVIREVQRFHQLGLTHRDIKADNILLRGTIGADGTPTVYTPPSATFPDCDTVIPMHCVENGIAPTIECTPWSCRDPWFMINLDGTPPDGTSDVWQVGLILYEILFAAAGLKCLYQHSKTRVMEAATPCGGKATNTRNRKRPRKGSVLHVTTTAAKEPGLMYQDMSRASNPKARTRFLISTLTQDPTRARAIVNAAVRVQHNRRASVNTSLAGPFRNAWHVSAAQERLHSLNEECNVQQLCETELSELWAVVGDMLALHPKDRPTLVQAHARIVRVLPKDILSHLGVLSTPPLVPCPLPPPVVPPASFSEADADAMVRNAREPLTQFGERREVVESALEQILCIFFHYDDQFSPSALALTYKLLFAELRARGPFHPFHIDTMITLASAATITALRWFHGDVIDLTTSNVIQMFIKMNGLRDSTKLSLSLSDSSTHTVSSDTLYDTTKNVMCCLLTSHGYRFPMWKVVRYFDGVPVLDKRSAVIMKALAVCDLPDDAVLPHAHATVVEIARMCTWWDRASAFSTAPEKLELRI